MPESPDILLCTRELKVGGLGGMKPTLFCYSNMSKKGSFVAKSFACVCRAHLSFIVIYEGFIVIKNSRVMRMEGKAGLYSVRVVHWRLKSSLGG